MTIPEPDTLFDDYSHRASPARTASMSIRGRLGRKDLKLDDPKGLTADQLAIWKQAYDAENDAFEKAALTDAERTRWNYQRYVKDYLRCVAGVDESVGQLLKYLDEAGLADNTLVVYSSDQGFYLGEHGWYDKRFMYEQSLRTPLIVRWPRVVEPGSREPEAIVSNLDFAATFLDATGLDVPADIQGRSIVPLLCGRTPENWRKSFYYHYYEHPSNHSVRKHYGVTNGRYKLIHYYEQDVDEWELFDLKQDPKELRSVYGQANYAAVQKTMEQELQRLRQELNVPANDPMDARKPRRDAPPAINARNEG